MATNLELASKVLSIINSTTANIINNTVTSYNLDEQSMRDICDEVVDLSKTFKEQKKQICNLIIKKYKKINLDFSSLRYYKTKKNKENNIDNIIINNINTNNIDNNINNINTNNVDNNINNINTNDTDNNINNINTNNVDNNIINNINDGDNINIINNEDYNNNDFNITNVINNNKRKTNSVLLIRKSKRSKKNN
ncbi:hypothetical protein Glove_253g21 [Diversispora epigaea]|uniref:Uncharacterized protein n=1 Tax=Diversispora epigaea TaxID=1348612 RepID=A0A397IFC8_9GLOM|nr:hypothetical protein Glove_253g21 [Diversispora epigaea]